MVRVQSLQKILLNMLNMIYKFTTLYYYKNFRVCIYNFPGEEKIIDKISIFKISIIFKRIYYIYKICC